MHLFIFWGFVVLFIGTLIVLLEADIVRPYFGISFYQGTFYVVYKIVINLFGLLFLIGLLMAVYRRYGQHLPKFRRSLSDDAIVLGILLFLGVTGFLLQALRLAATQDPAAPIHWVSYPIALALGGVDPAVLTGAHAVTWWSHMLANTALLVYIPVSKLAHIFTGPTNVFLRATDRRAARCTSSPTSKSRSTSASPSSRISTWKQLANFDACMRCGRCLDFCPTFNTGKAAQAAPADRRDRRLHEPPGRPAGRASRAAARRGRRPRQRADRARAAQPEPGAGHRQPDRRRRVRRRAVGLHDLSARAWSSARCRSSTCR